MIRIPRPVLDQIERAAATAYPAECCGLIVGREEAHGYQVRRAVESRNLKATEHVDRFEVDPKVRFDVMRELEGTAEHIIGHYHSHPDHPALPSETDLANAWEPEMIWLITAVQAGRATETAAHILNDDHQSFRSLSLRVEDPS